MDRKNRVIRNEKAQEYEREEKMKYEKSIEDDKKKLVSRIKKADKRRI